MTNVMMKPFVAPSLFFASKVITSAQFQRDLGASFSLPQMHDTGTVRLRPNSLERCQLFGGSTMKILMLVFLLLPFFYGLDHESKLKYDKINDIIVKKDRDIVAFEPVGLGAERTAAMTFILSQCKDSADEWTHSLTEIVRENELSPAVRVYALAGLRFLRSGEFVKLNSIIRSQIGTVQLNFGEMGTVVGMTSVNSILDRFNDKDAIFRMGME